MVYRLPISVFVLFIYLRKMRGGGGEGTISPHSTDGPTTVADRNSIFRKSGSPGWNGGLDGIWSTGASECQKSWLGQTY